MQCSMLNIRNIWLGIALFNQLFIIIFIIWVKQSLVISAKPFKFNISVSIFIIKFFSLEHFRFSTHNQWLLNEKFWEKLVLHSECISFMWLIISSSMTAYSNNHQNVHVLNIFFSSESKGKCSDI